MSANAYPKHPDDAHDWSPWEALLAEAAAKDAAELEMEAERDAAILLFDEVLREHETSEAAAYKRGTSVGILIGFGVAAVFVLVGLSAASLFVL